MTRTLKGLLRKARGLSAGTIRTNRGDRQGDAAQRLEDGRDRLLVDGADVEDSPAGPVVPLTDLGIEVVDRLPVDVGVLEVEHLFGVDMVAGRPEGERLDVFPPEGQPGGEGEERLDGQRDDHPAGEDARIPAARQLGDNPDRQPDGDIRGDRFQGGA